MRPLNKKVPYTKSTKPRTCNHLKVSHPRKSDTIQMKRVLHVSMVDLAVALTVRVTDNPKKLKPLRKISISTTIGAASRIIPDANHDEKTRYSDGSILCDFPPCFNQIPVSVFSSISSTHCEIHDKHSK